MCAGRGPGTIWGRWQPSAWGLFFGTVRISNGRVSYGGSFVLPSSKCFCLALILLDSLKTRPQHSPTFAPPPPTTSHFAIHVRWMDR
jgi:hypothetical protein